MQQRIVLLRRVAAVWALVGLCGPFLAAQSVRAVRAGGTLAWSGAEPPQRVRTSPEAPFHWTLTIDGQGKPMLTVPTGTPPGRYMADIGSRRVEVAVTAAAPLPESVRPPVALLNGWQIQTLSGTCGVRPSSDTFGKMEDYLTQEGVPVLFFDNCKECPGESIEGCAGALEQFLAVQRRVDGREVERFDLVTHSMGGLIARAYLAGLRDGGWRPPLDPRVRKLILFASPNFGAYTIVSLDAQTREMQEGSWFQWQLGTWNQGGEDLRGVDALAVAGRADHGRGDGVISTLSASLSFAREDERTRLLDYCHTGGAASVFFCGFRPGMLAIDSPAHPSWRIVDSFLADTSEWKSIGVTPSADPELSRSGGALALLVNEDSAPQVDQPVDTGWAAAGTATFRFATVTGLVELQGPIRAGGMSIWQFKPGPVIGRIVSLDADPGAPIQVVAGGRIALIGNDLTDEEGRTAVFANNDPLTVLQAEPNFVVADLPARFIGGIWFTVRNAKGTQTVKTIVIRARE
jgi:pimeloyl-ACP methyl ester carboxylesterase